MKKNGFAAMYMVYSFFLVFSIIILSIIMLNNYRRVFLNALKNDIKEELINYQGYTFLNLPENYENNK